MVSFWPSSPTEADQEQITLMLDAPSLGQRRAMEVGCGCATGSLDEDDRLDSPHGSDVLALRICAT